MIRHPLISVIICFYNEEVFLEEAIESVVNQTYQNWEILLVDDGSKDRSTAIAKKFTLQHPDKIFYQDHPLHENMGLSASRNLGISESNGELVCFLDADDVWMAEKLQVQMQIMAKNPKAGMLCEASLYWYSWLNNDRKDEIIQIGVPDDRVFEPMELIKLLYPLSTGAAPCPSGIMVRKSVLLKVKGFEIHFTGNYQLYEDQAFLFKVYLTKPIYISSHCNNKYRQRKGSIVSKVKEGGHYHAVRRYFLLWTLTYLSDNQIGNPQLKKLINRALSPYNFTILSFLNISYLTSGKKLFFKVLRTIRYSFC